jgi:hypothetical protein
VTLSAFDDKQKKPGPDELASVLGRSGVHWDDLKSYFASQYAPVDEAWVFAGANWGWSLKLKQKKRTVAVMTPCEKHFLVGFALGEKAVAAARGSGLPQPVLTMIEEAKKYPEGRAVRIEIRNKKDREVAKQLAAIKMAH